MSAHIADLAEKVFKSVRKVVPDDTAREQCYREIKDAFEDADCSTLYEIVEHVTEDTDPVLVKVLGWDEDGNFGD